MRIKPDFTILVPLINTNAHFFFGEERFRDFTVYIATRMGEKIPNDEKDLKHLARTFLVWWCMGEGYKRHLNISA